MAQRCLCVLALAAMLLLVFATVSRSVGLRSDEHQRASRIPAEFSKEELVAMKEALKGEPWSPSPIYTQMSVLPSPGQPVTPRFRRKASATAAGAPTRTPAPAPFPAHRAPAWGRHTSPIPASWNSRVPCLTWKLQLHPSWRDHRPLFPLLASSITRTFIGTSLLTFESLHA